MAAAPASEKDDMLTATAHSRASEESSPDSAARLAATHSSPALLAALKVKDKSFFIKIAAGVAIAVVIAGVGYWGFSKKPSVDEKPKVAAGKPVTPAAAGESKEIEKIILALTEEANKKTKGNNDSVLPQNAAVALPTPASPPAPPVSQDGGNKIMDISEWKQNKATGNNDSAPSQNAGVSPVHPVPPAPQSNAIAILERASQCAGIESCIQVMLEAALPANPDAMQVVAARIGRLKDAQRGDRKVARGISAQGHKEFKDKNYEAAFSFFRQASEVDPLDIEIQANVGFAALRANRFQEAETALLKALKLDPRRTTSWIPLGEVYSMTKSADAALRAVLVAYEFSANREKTRAFFEEKAVSCDLVEMRPVYSAAFKRVQP